jgi:site-specific DNA recombinase
MAAYVRYSSALQDATSLDDQLRKCREAATRQGCTIPDHLVFSDAAIQNPEAPWNLYPRSFNGSRFMKPRI